MTDSTLPILPVFPTHAQIARLAFQIWTDTGKPENSAHRNWVSAEQLLILELNPISRALPPLPPRTAI